MSRIEEQRAFAHIRRAFARSTPDYDPVVGLYLNHHMDALDADTLRRLTRADEPEAHDLLDAFVSTGERVSRDGRTKAHDFALRGGVGEGCLAVQFDRDGEFVDIDWLE